MERGSKQRIIVPIIKREARLFATSVLSKFAANGTGKLPIQTMGAFLKKKVVVSMARPQQCG